MAEFLDVDAALARVGLAREEATWPDLFVPARTTLALPRESALSISTESAAMYKRWIGLADDEIESGARLGVSARPRTATPSADPEREDIENAALAYLWGPSKEVAAWRDTIERTFGPFSAHVVTFGTIHLGEGASLVIENTPAIVIAERLILDGGSLTISTPSHLTIGEVIKRRYPEENAWNGDDSSTESWVDSPPRRLSPAPAFRASWRRPKRTRLLPRHD